MPVRSSLPVLLLAGALPFSAAHAQTPDNTETTTLPSVLIRAQHDTEDNPGSPVRGITARRARTATKTSTPLIEAPQSISVITRDQLGSQGTKTVTSALGYSAGARSTSFDNRRDTVRLRGADVTHYMDGLLRATGYDNITRPDPYTLERIELLRGPSSVLYGQGGVGGIVNLSSKKPQPTAQREIQAQLGSFRHRQLAADLTGPLTDDGQWLYRLIALGRDSGTQVDHVPDDRLLIAPSLTWVPSERTSLNLQLHHQKDDSGSLIGFFPWEGTLLPNRFGQIPTSRFNSEPGWDKFEARQSIAAYQFSHTLANEWTVRQNLRYSNSEVDYRSLYTSFRANPATGRPARPVFDADGRTLQRDFYWGLNDLQMFQVDTHAEGRFRTGELKHTVLAGIDVQRSRSTSRNARGLGTPIDIHAPVYGNFTPPATTTPNPAVRQRQLGIYVQDQLKWQSWLLTAGVRHDRARSATDGSADGQVRDSVWTKRVALGYQPTQDWQPYVSYAESFQPLGGVDVYNNPYKPQRGKQLETGVKWQPADRGISAYAALYALRDTNVKVTDPANPLNSIQTGEIRTRGFEAEITGDVGRWQWTAAYAWTDARNHRSSPATQGTPVAGVPRHSASGWLNYFWSGKESNGWSTGLGARFANSSWSGTDAVHNPRWLLFDASIGYRHDDWRLSLNGTNLADKVQIHQCLQRGDCFYGPRRTLTLTATYRF